MKEEMYLLTKIKLNIRLIIGNETNDETIEDRERRVSIAGHLLNRVDRCHDYWRRKWIFDVFHRLLSFYSSIRRLSE